MGEKGSGSFKAVLSPKGEVSLSGFVGKNVPQDDDTKVTGRWNRPGTEPAHG